MLTRRLCFIGILLMMVLHTGEVLGQMQRIVAGGQITDNEGLPVPNAKMHVRFNGDTLFTTLSDNTGNYILQSHTYGSIKKIDILWQADGYEPLAFVDYEVYRLVSPLDFVMKKIPKTNGRFTRTDYQRFTICCGRPIPLHPNFFKSYPGLMFRAPWGTFAYIKPTEPVIYYPRITQQITVLDANGQPMPNARVEVKVPDDESRWGFTDENGKLTLHMEFDLGARFATVSVYAQGYTPLKLRRQELDVHTQRVYRLQKVS